MTPAPPVTTPTVVHKFPRWRRWLAATLVVVACVLAPLSVIAVWTRNTLLNTDQYVDTVAPLAQDPVITDRIATVLVDAVFARVDVEQQVRDALPERATVIAPAIAQAVHQLADQVAHRFLASEQFKVLWREANRRAHSRVRAVLTGEGRVVQGGSKVDVQLGPMVQKVRDKLDSLGLDIFPASERSNTQLVLFQSQELANVQGGVDLLQTLSTTLPILIAVLLGVGIFLLPSRRRTILRAALGLALAMAMTLILLVVARSAYLDAFKPGGRAAASAAYNQILEFLTRSLGALLTLGLVVAIAAWAAGPGRVATRMRTAGERMAVTTADRIRGEGIDLSGAGAIVARNLIRVRVVIVGFGAVLLMVLSRTSGITVLVLAVVVLVAFALVEVLTRSAKPAGIDDMSGPSQQTSGARK